MPNDCIVICDNNNGKVSLYDSSLFLIESYELSRPRDVSVINTDDVIVILPEKETFKKVLSSK